MKDKAIGLGVTKKLQAEHVRDLTLVPTQQRADRGDARDRTTRGASPDDEVLLAGLARHIAQFEAAGLGVPSIGHLHPTAALDQGGDRVSELLRLDRDWLDGRHGIPGE